MDFEVVRGDIAEQSAAVLVNAAGTSLQMGSGVAGALRRAGGEALNDAAVEQGPIDLGAVAVTDAFDLDADHVIHAAAMPHYGDGRATAESVSRPTGTHWRGQTNWARRRWSRRHSAVGSPGSTSARAPGSSLRSSTGTNRTP